MYGVIYQLLLKLNKYRVNGLPNIKVSLNVVNVPKCIYYLCMFMWILIFDGARVHYKMKSELLQFILTNCVIKLLQLDLEGASRRGER